VPQSLKDGAEVLREASNALCIAAPCRKTSNNAWFCRFALRKQVCLGKKRWFRLALTGGQRRAISSPRIAKERRWHAESESQSKESHLDCSELRDLDFDCSKIMLNTDM
jgi:hypothetical protein